MKKFVKFASKSNTDHKSHIPTIGSFSFQEGLDYVEQKLHMEPIAVSFYILVNRMLRKVEYCK